MFPWRFEGIVCASLGLPFECSVGLWVTPCTSLSRRPTAAAVVKLMTVMKDMINLEGVQAPNIRQRKQIIYTGNV